MREPNPSFTTDNESALSRLRYWALWKKQGAMVAKMQGDTDLRTVLFNCCTNHRPPDFSLFDAIEVSPVARNPGMIKCSECWGTKLGAKMDDGRRVDCTGCDGKGEVEDPNGSTHCEVIHDDRVPDMWSVYGHFNHDDPRNKDEGGVVCLTDCSTEALARVVGLLFEMLLP